MKPILFLFAIPLLALAQVPDAGPLTNERVVQLVQSRVSADEVSRVIAAAPSVNFNLTPAETDKLLGAGVSEDTIKRMSAREHGVPFAPNRVTVQAYVAEHGYNVTYDGGSVSSLKGGQSLKLFIDGNQIRFSTRSGFLDDSPRVQDTVTIPADAITQISYGQDVHRRVGTAIAVGMVSFGVGALTVLSKSKKHFVGLTWADGAQKGGMALQCSKSDYRGILEGIEGITGKKVVESSSLSVKN